MNTSRSRPLAAFWLLTLAVAVVMAQGLREDAARVLVGAGVPAPIAGVLATNMMLGEHLEQAPEPAQADRATRHTVGSVAAARVSTGPSAATSGSAATAARHVQTAGQAGATQGAQASPSQPPSAKPRAAAAQQTPGSGHAKHHAKAHAKPHAKWMTERQLWTKFLQRFELRHDASLKHHGKHHAKKHHAKKHHAKKHHAKKHHAKRHHRR